MRRLSRDSWLALGLFLLLTLVTTISVVQQAQASLTDPPLASYSTQPQGSQALWRYLESQQLQLTDSVGESFGVPSGVDLALVLEPTVAFTPGEWAVLRGWVEDGGTLLLAGSTPTTVSLAQELEVRFGVVPSSETAVSNQTPLLNSPSLAEIAATTPYFLRPQRDDFVTLLANAAGYPTAIAFAEGNGRVILTTLTEPFSNLGLQTEGNAELVLNLLNATPDLRGIWFNEWHHGIRPQADDALSSSNWLQRTPGGRALLLVLAIIFIGLILRGRHFGRPVLLHKDIVRRAPLEYITGIANLSRRAGHRTAVLQHYHDRLKRDLGARYRLNPSLPDEEFIAQLASYQPNLDTDALRQTLQKLSQTNVSESDMVQIVREATLFGRQ
ncbi:MAG: DUF4350 domain-containing protein [Ardenticatenaceae bacterium]|nr:DUF4350 domain-containing protein [Anaerolineales bacterium]MCB8937393.1 DUF4350 domain-containing protein [Ardenticatenaceae bacterium]MCB8975412.1 DUF4350 domain-containing protein [Ardenticatenaceae bacterium]